MPSIFPWDLPWPTAWYLILYLVTFALHHFFMHYVLAGSLYVGWCSLFPGAGVPRSESRLALLIRDWLPFVLSAAITAGVAPLLFIQIVYPKHFYTANLLLGWRWMAVVPLLIVAFYLLYLLKSKAISRWPLVVRVGVALITAGCFVFVGFCWTSNHILSNSESSWGEIYYTGRLALPRVAILARMGIWIAASFTTMSVIAAWQLRGVWGNSHAEATRLATLAIGGVTIALLFAVVYGLVSGGTRDAITASSGMVYTAVLGGGACLQIAGWLKIHHAGQLQGSAIKSCTAGLVISLLGGSVLRELIRMHDIDVAMLHASHLAASKIGGLTLFLVFAVINGLLITFCITLVRRVRYQ
jgi:hypothetical protein